MADEPVINNDNEEVEDEQEDFDKDDKVQEQKQEKEERPRRRTKRDVSGGERQQMRRSSSDDYRRPTGRFQPRRKVCMFCADRMKVIDWKNLDTLRRFMNSNGSIRPRRKTGTCAKHQRQLAVAIKRARHLALTPFTDEHVRLYGKD